MSITIGTAINEGSTVGVSLTLMDSSGSAAQAEAITAISWGLYDAAGTVVNGRSGVSVSPANPVVIELEHADTTYAQNAVVKILSMSVVWTYTDSVLGSGTKKTEEYLLTVNRVRGQ